MSTTESSTAARPRSSAQPKQRGPQHPRTNCEVRYGTKDGAEVAYVPLSGKRGIGKEAIIEAGDWHWISKRFGTHWVLMCAKKDPKGRIVSGSSQAVAGAKAICMPLPARGNPSVFLSRIVAGAQTGDLVFARNGNTLDLRYDNLHAISGEDLRAIYANFAATGDIHLLEAA